MQEFLYYPNSGKNLAMQIADKLKKEIESGVIKKNEQLLSINEFSNKHKCARNTVERAYNELKKSGYILSINNKGYYVTGAKKKQLKILLVFNKLGHFKEMIHEGFISAIGKNVKVDLYVHHYDVTLLNEIIEEKLGYYHYYVIMPHFFLKTNKSEYLKVLKNIDPNELVLLDKDIPELGKNRRGVFQDFEHDIFNALQSYNEDLLKYKKLVLVNPRNSNIPSEINAGARRFCTLTKKKFTILTDLERFEVEKGSLYITTVDEDLAELIKKIRKLKYNFGKDLGVISFNETVFKDILGISVITTDFKRMGIAAAEKILNHTHNLEYNPFQLIKRNSF